MKQILILTIIAALSSTSCTAAITDIATSINDPLHGLTINFIGDSYVQNHKKPIEETWHYKMAQNHDMKYNNYGRNGSRVSKDRTNEGFGKSVLERTTWMDSSADIVIVIAGHNDTEPIKDNKQLQQAFADSVQATIDRIRIQCPKAKIGWISPWYVDRPGFKNVVKIIKKICKKNNVPVLDNYRKDAVIQVRDEQFRNTYFQGNKGKGDTAHLNNKGHDLYLPTGEAFVLSLIEN